MLEPDLEFYQDGVTDDGVDARIYVTVQREVYGDALVISLVRYEDGIEDEPDRYAVVADRDESMSLIEEDLPHLLDLRAVGRGRDEDFIDVVWTDPELSGMTLSPDMIPDDPGMAFASLHTSTGSDPEPDKITWGIETTSAKEPNPIIAVRLTPEAAHEFLTELDQCAAHLGWTDVTELPLTETDLNHLVGGADREIGDVLVIADHSRMRPFFEAKRDRWPVQVVLTESDLETLTSKLGAVVIAPGVPTFRVISCEDQPLPDEDDGGGGYYDIASNHEQTRLWWAIEGTNPPDTDDEVFVALKELDGDPHDKAAVARAWGNPNAAQWLLQFGE